MLRKLTAAASLAFALCLSAPAARAAQDSNRTTPSPEILPLELPPAITPPAPHAPSSAGPAIGPRYGRGMGVGAGGGTGSGGGVGAGLGVPSETRRDPDGPFHPREVTKKAVVTSKPEPSFTAEAQENDTAGLVRLRAVFSKDGRVTNISVVKGLPDGLTEKAISAARAIKFRPAQKDGRAVSQWITLEYNFNIYNYPDEALIERKAVILDRPEPEYTEEARRQKVAGTVVLDVLLTRKGRARVRQIVSGLPHGLTETAVEAAGRIKFTPAEDKGKKVTVVRRLEYVFSPD